MKTYTMILEYAKVFDQEGKPGDMDRGDAKSTQKWLRELAKNPEAKVNCYFTSEEDIQDLLETSTFENEVTNPKTGETSTRIKEGNEEFGVGKFLQLKRKKDDVREFVDRKTGQVKEADYGGLPEIVVRKEDEAGNAFYEEFSYDELGPITNGSTAKVRFHEKYLRLEKIGVIDLVEWVEGDPEVDEEGF